MTTSSSHRRIQVALLAACATASCRASSTEWATSEPMLTAASVVGTEEGIRRVAAAMCERELGCGNVGRARRFPDGPTCAESAAAGARRAMGDAVCPTGVAERNLDRCTTELRTAACAIDLAQPTDLVSCRSAALCGVGTPASP